MSPNPVCHQLEVEISHVPLPPLPGEAFNVPGSQKFVTPEGGGGAFEPLLWPITRVLVNCVAFPLNTSSSQAPSMPEIVPWPYCQSVHVGQGAVALGAPVCGFWPF